MAPGQCPITPASILQLPLAVLLTEVKSISSMQASAVICLKALSYMHKQSRCRLCSLWVNMPDGFMRTLVMLFLTTVVMIWGSCTLKMAAAKPPKKENKMLLKERRKKKQCHKNRLLKCAGLMGTASGFQSGSAGSLRILCWPRPHPDPTHPPPQQQQRPQLQQLQVPISVQAVVC